MTHYYLRAEAGGFVVVGHAVGFVVEGDPDEPSGRSVVASSLTGGRPESHVDGEGGVTIDLTPPLDVGRPNEWHVMKILMQAVSAEGTACAPCENASDERGEDGAVLINGERVPVQAISVPADEQVWRELVRNSKTSIQVDHDGVVAIVRGSLERKRGRVHSGTLLVLDASHIGAAVGPRLVEDYVATYGDPATEFGWHSVWLVGPTLGSTRRLSSGADV